MNADEQHAAQAPPTEVALTDAERTALRDLLDELVEATEDRDYWLGRARETAMEIRHRLSDLLDRDDEQ